MCHCNWSGVLASFFSFRYSVLHNGNHIEQEKLSVQNDTESQESCFWHRPHSHEDHHWKVPFLTALPAAQTPPEHSRTWGLGAGLNCLLRELLNNEGKNNVAKSLYFRIWISIAKDCLVLFFPPNAFISILVLLGILFPNQKYIFQALSIEAFISFRVRITLPERYGTNAK